LENFLPGLAQVMDLGNIVAMFVGTLIGIIVGALPGLGSVVGLTICLPFTFSMDQMPALSVLMGVYCGSVYGGSISAILINTPGTPQSAATCFDGFPMAEQGHADKALGWATVASVAGGLFSCVVLILAAPQLAAIAVKFGPIETFALICMALTCIASVSADGLVKGLLGGLIGLFCATVGSDPVTGDIRFDFGIFALSSGLDLIAVVVGIFALAEVFARVAERGRTGAPKVHDCGMRLPAWSEWRPRLNVLVKSCTIGAVVGIMPGTGAATASFISYAEAKRSSPRRDRMGRGEADGIIASEAANNAVTGGALVPTLALGIPGDAITAVMMSTMIIHGITPGVRLMAENAVTVYACFIALVIINFMLLPQGIVVARLFARILKAPEPLLLSMVVVLCLLGTWGVRGNSFDLLVTLSFGVIGYFMRAFGFPAAPVVIGLVLGPQLEMSLRQGLILTDNDFMAFFDYPLAVGLFVVTLLILFLPLFRNLLGRRSPASVPSR
jgi:putative tricarboxylic transport membrane protein